jgi:glutamine amidotransferase
MIHIVDYGLGNIQAFVNMYKRLGFEVRRATNPSELDGASKLILPGVGAFDHALNLLESSGMLPLLNNLVLEEKVPVLGICVGMQILANDSDEGSMMGLGWIPGRVKAFKSDASCANLPLPHMGWNDVQPEVGSKLFSGLESDARFYFLHSFYFECDKINNVAAKASYGLDFSCAVSNENVYGVQFHPEKSHHYGAQLLKNFAEF